MNTIKLSEYCRNAGIIQQFTTPHSPFQNGTAERYGGTICNLTRTCLIDYGMSAQFWGEAIQHVIWYWNRTPNNLVKGMCPYRAYYGTEPEWQHLRAFGINCWRKNTSQQLKKLDPRGLVLVPLVRFGI